VELIRLLRDRPVVGVVIGDGTGLPFLRERCQQYGITDRVRFLGRVPYEDLPRYLNAMDICLSTQSDDLAGRVRTTGKLPLYMACGRYILASRVGEAALVLSNDMLVEHVGPFDPEYPARLARRVEDLLADPSLLRRGLANRVIAETRFDYDSLARRVDALIGRFADSRSVRSA
jgi:glycosyltransferase involved in cell wall biosynthesis